MRHDACGVGFIADLRHRSTRSLVDHGLTALRRLTHRGASADLGAVDGCGVTTAIPWPLVSDAFGGSLPAGRTHALGMIFVHRRDGVRALVAVERELRRVGATAIVWRDVPIDGAAVLPAQRASTPRVVQLVAAFDDSRKVADVKIYRARLRIEQRARTLDLGLKATAELAENAEKTFSASSAGSAIAADWDGSRTKQFASARFGVTPAYLRSADELQIKIAQGSKPGEGGQLPALKVVPHIAKLRHAQEGTPLISPPVHHDIYSIEDLAQLVFDLRAFHPSARINVKLVASNVGIIAAGVAKAGADAIQVSGHDGGTGASPRASIKHAGLPWEIGLSEAHQALTRAGLRRRVVLQTDGGLKTGRDIAMAAALGAEEYGFGTAALVAIGCVMARQCHANTCPVGIATQREDLRRDVAGTPEMLIGYLMLIANEVREILASLGLRRLEDLVGRVDLLGRRAGVKSALSLDAVIRNSEFGIQNANTHSKFPIPDSTLDVSSELLDTIGPDHPLTVTGPIANTDRAFGAGIAGAIAARFGDAGLPDGSVHMTMTGSAGQSFGAFSLPGMRLVLVGDANDGLGKGMHGGEIVVAPPARERGRARQVLAGNAALYGATGGRVFIAGTGGERFAVRNSGATAVVEGAGDHACEYMTGGVAYVLDRKRELVRCVNPQLVAVDAMTAADRKALRDLLEAHERLTGSRVARAILRNDPSFSTFVRVAPVTTPRRVEAVAEVRAVNE